jgi:hypothetical protein
MSNLKKRIERLEARASLRDALLRVAPEKTPFLSALVPFRVEQKMRDAGMTRWQIAKEFKVSIRTIDRRLKANREHAARPKAQYYEWQTEIPKA